MEKGRNVLKGRSEPGQTAARMLLRWGHPREAVGFLLSLPVSGRAVGAKPGLCPLSWDRDLGTTELLRAELPKKPGA